MLTAGKKNYHWATVTVVVVLGLAVTFVAGLVYSGRITWADVLSFFDEAGPNNEYAEQVASMDNLDVCRLKLPEVRLLKRTPHIEIMGSPQALGMHGPIIPRVYWIGAENNAQRVQCFYLDLRGYGL